MDAGQEQCCQGNVQVSGDEWKWCLFGTGTNLEEEGMRITLEDSVRALAGEGHSDQNVLVMAKPGWRGTNENERGMEEGRWKMECQYAERWKARK